MFMGWANSDFIVDPKVIFKFSAISIKIPVIYFYKNGS